ncbi:MAG: enoyl-CoA hydratase/isomerase family protein [Gammaproteobacteria bacterium]|nr:enoyl-CoA hydratase/isomerase family protein [Gammaproteobacteria bacterium]
MSSKAFETIIYKKHTAYAEISLNRPHRLNAVVETLYNEFIEALQKAEADPDVRAVMLTGEGRAFCVGADLKEHEAAERTQYQRRQYLQLGNDACETISRLSKPVVAVIYGYALGAGAEMACACDFAIMAESAQIGFPEVSIGTSVGGGVSQFLPRLVGLAKARELVFLGTKIPGTEAERIGLVTKSAPDDVLYETAAEFMQSLASKAPISMNIVKQLLNNSSHLDMGAQLQLELDGVFMCTTTSDWQEGIDAFAEKRVPHFKGL